MQYIGYEFVIHPPAPWTEILLAKLSQIEFESFEETDAGLKAFILQDFDDEDFVQEQISEMEQVHISYEKSLIDQVNWNAEWEKNFHPINIDDRCYIRAEFHEAKSDIPFEIVIQPKMSFGTGHHETTHLMVDYLLDADVVDKSVLDMGTGTGILAILAKMKGANPVVGIDIDEWSYENAIENATRNSVEVKFYKGGAEAIPKRKFDIIFANINKNILIEDMPFYVNAMSRDGELYLSGLYSFDKEDIVKVVTSYGLNLIEVRDRNEWIALKFKKKIDN